ncbi:hypothetical protein MMC25_000779 [Agyrium rufum]|nr:hypothetical protein [Agyrium rufum]
MGGSSRNPIAFRPWPVTIITSVFYIALLVVLLLIHLIVPPAPTQDDPLKGLNLTEAWHDLQVLSSEYRPFNSHRNDEVRNWLLQRVDSILTHNGVKYSTSASELTTRRSGFVRTRYANRTEEKAPVVVFNDITSNVTFSIGPTSSYFEGTNILIYIRGSEDPEGEWWSAYDARRESKPPKKHGVMVNAHYDSVATGYGATDAGVGVISVLQLIKYFTTKGNKPKKGVLALLNNGEEGWLNGAYAFTQHPMARYAHTFVNLEGAGAGGRAVLFRSTDTEVTKFYQGVKYPFGDVVSGDGFKRGLIRSGTDYSVFVDGLGLRGLDIAFMEPRASYHTDQDDARHTGRDSVWHMLSAAVKTVSALADDTSSTFEGGSDSKGKVNAGTGTNGVWFDVFGSSFADFSLETLFALSVTLLVAAPVFLIIFTIILYKIDKFYLFSSSKHHHQSGGDENVPLRGWRGFFRYPVIFVLAAAGMVGLAYLINKVNPFIVYSSPYSIWSMMFSAWVFVVWFLSRAADFVRPSAFHRSYALIWMFAGGWLVLVLTTVSENNFNIASGYFTVFYFAAIFLATSIAFLELFGLSKKTVYAEIVDGTAGSNGHGREGSLSSANLLAAEDEEPAINGGGNGDEEPEEATESTSLLRGAKSNFNHYTTPSRARDDHEEPVDESIDEGKKARVYGHEQPWSWSLPTWTWLLQFLIIATTAMIFVAPLGLLIMSALHQTLSDGNSALIVYLFAAVITILVLAPLGPFLHRYTYHIPMFLLCVFAGTLIYNLVAFPFSASNRLKVYFLQTVDLDTGLNDVVLSTIGSPFINAILDSLPSTAGQIVTTGNARRPGLIDYSWPGVAPRVVQPPPTEYPGVPPQFGFADWLNYNVTRPSPSTPSNPHSAQFHLSGRNTRSCQIRFNRAISSFHVAGQAPQSSLFQNVGEDGSKAIKLWSREWEKEWEVDVTWEVGGGEDDQGGLDGKVLCFWNDEGKRKTIPALEEMRRFAPVWVAPCVETDGLVMGSKSFLI